MKTVLAAVLLFASSAAAEKPTLEIVPTCVEIDDTRDQLPASQREHARRLLVRVLERADQLIVETGCATTIKLSHQRNGELVHVRVGNDLVEESMWAHARADMPATYKALVAALFVPPAPAPQPAIEVEATPTTQTGPSADLQPEQGGDVRVRQIYSKLGVASLAGRSGSSLTFGWRRGTNVTLDLGLAIVVAGETGDTATSYSARLQALKYTSAPDGSSGYWGGGLSFGATQLEAMSEDGGGVQLEATIGYEWNRRGKHPISVEANTGLPLYTIGETYPATFVASFGVAM